jgi:restriction system protein
MAISNAKLRIEMQYIFIKYSKKHARALWVLDLSILILYCLDYFNGHFAISACLGSHLAIGRMHFERIANEEINDRLQTYGRNHMDALVRQYHMKVRTGPYGNKVHHDWDKELTRFINEIFFPTLTRFELRQVEKFDIFPKLKSALHDAVAVEAWKRSRQSEFNPEMGGLAFEKHCADILIENGWKAFVTPPSGDQGADIYAEKGNKRVVIQAKLHRAPIGNKAVQEIHSAKAHYQATTAIVVGNSSFTPSAQQLAHSTGVKLLHHLDLPRLSSLLHKAHQPKTAKPMDESVSIAR